MRDRLDNNGGYTLVEMIIVIAIIAVMSGVGALTISSIRASQATSSMQRFDDELSALEMRTKTLQSGCAIRIVKNEANYDIYYGTCTNNNPSSFKADSTKPDAVLQRVTLYYDKDYNADTSSSILREKIIMIRKTDSQVLSGYGEYMFCKYDSKQAVGSVIVNQYTGSHTYGKN